MIDLSGLRESEEYTLALTTFNVTDCHHNQFSDIHISKAKNRCPFCECLLDGSITRKSNSKKHERTDLKATIDHYRPIEYYNYLKCEHTNYLLMCSDCNNVLKKSLFPLFKNQGRAVNGSKLSEENPLIVNPIDDDIFELFTLYFLRSISHKNVIELAINPRLTPASYLYEKAKKTISIFKLGNCSNFDNRNNVESCRIDIFETHFNAMYEFALAFKNKSKALKSLLEDNSNRYATYGYTKFILTNNFQILVP